MWNWHRRSVAVLFSCTRSCVTRCTIFMVLYLGRRCQCGLHAALWSYIGMLVRFLAAEPRLLFPCQYLCGTNLVTPYSMLRAWRVSRGWPMPSLWPNCSLPFCLLLFPLLFFHSMGLYCVAWVFGLIVC